MTGYNFCIKKIQVTFNTELQIRGSIEDNSGIIFLISQQKPIVTTL